MSSREKISLRSIYAAFDKHPRWEAALEVVFNIIIGFAPFLIIAFAKSESNIQIMPIFWSFFSAGELIISLFSTCAIILWLTFFKPYKIEGITGKFSVLILIILGILFSGVVIGENIGFKEEISEFNQKKILVLYVVSLAVWFFVSIANTSANSEVHEDPAKAIDKKYFGEGR